MDNTEQCCCYGARARPQASHWSGKVRESEGKSGNFVKSEGRISKSQGNFFNPSGSGYLYYPLILIL